MTRTRKLITLRDKKSYIAGDEMKTSDVIAYFGTQDAVAEALGISQAAVSQWGAEVPELRAFQLERITNGKLSVQDKQAA